MSEKDNYWDLRIHHYHITPEDDRKAGIRRCASCGRPIVVGAECMDCAMKHPGTAAAGWATWGLKKIFGQD